MSLPLLINNIKITLITLCIGISSFYYCNSNAQELTNEDKIKASFVFNFIRFIKWPSNKFLQPSQTINVCIINHVSSNNLFYKAFLPVAGKQVNGHKLALHKITKFDRINHCHVLYIEKEEKLHIKKLLYLTKKNKILSISDINGFCAEGGIIGMVKRKGKIRVEINLQSATSSGFIINSNLLEVATIVKTIVDSQ